MKFTFPGFSAGMPTFAAKVLGATRPLLSVLVHFFEHGRWGLLIETGIEEQALDCRRSALHPGAGRAISDRHTRTPVTRGANLLRAPSVLMSLA